MSGKKKIHEKRHFSLLFFILILLCLGLTASVFAQTEHFSTEDALRDHLASLRGNGSGSFEFTCDGELYYTLRQDDFLELYRLLVRAGYSYDHVQISYNDFRHFVSINGARYTGLPWAECASAEDVRQAFLDLSWSADGFVLICPKSLVMPLVEGNTLNIDAAQSGINSFSCTYSLDTGLIRIADPVPFDRPAAAAADMLQFSAAIAQFAAQGIDDFYIIFSPELFADFKDDPRQKTIILGSSRLGNYWSTMDLNSCAVHFSSVEFTDAPRAICYSVSDVPDAIRRMGAAGISDFELIFPDKDVFEMLAANDFALLLELEASAGMSRGNLSYSSASDRIILTDAVIIADMVKLETTAQAIVYTEAHTAAGASDIHLFCTPELYQLLLGDLMSDRSSRDGMNRINDLVSHEGIFDYNITASDAAHVISIHINRLYPGTAILIAARGGDDSRLSERERAVWTVAAKIAADARNDDPLLTAKYIHDWLCAHVVYLNDETTDEDDNAIGAILNGAANCDGYTDAFYLIGSLAGLHVRYQHGDSYNKDIRQSRASETHIWNLLEINGAWHMIDVTWDDEADGWSYLWFNVGRDIADRLHYWNEDMTVALAPTTERLVSSDREFYIHSEAELNAAIDQAQQLHLRIFHLLFTDPALAVLEEDARMTVLRRSFDGSLTYSWNERMALLTFYDLNW